MRLKADVPIVVNSRRCGQKNDLAVGTKHRLGQRYKLGSNSLLLKIDVHSKIRKIAAIAEVCYRPSNANEEILAPTCGNNVRIVQHTRRQSKSSTGLLADKVERINKSRNSSTETVRANEKFMPNVWRASHGVDNRQTVKTASAAENKAATEAGLENQG
jgi:hypothetical protein